MMVGIGGAAIGEAVGAATGQNNGRGGGGDRDGRDAFGGLDIGIGLGRDRAADAQGRKSTLKPKGTTKDSTGDVDDAAQEAEPEDAATKLAKALRRGRRASILASSGNQGLGSTSVTRPGGRRAKVLLG